MGNRLSDIGRTWTGAAATVEEILGVPLDSDIYAATRDGYPDLRVVDDRGAQVPYVLEPAGERRTIQVREPCTSRVLSLHVDEGKALEIVVALDEKAPSASGATIRTPLVDYERRVRVYGSRDGKDWALLASDRLIYDYTRFMDIRNRDIEFPVNEYRQLKLVVEQELDDRESPLRELIRSREVGKQDRQVEITQTQRRPFRIDGVELWRTVEKEGGRKVETVRYPVVGFRVEHDPKKKETRVEIQSRREPLVRFSLGTASRNFSRTARVRVPVEHGVRTDWVEVGRATLSLDSVPRIPPRGAAGRFFGTAAGALPARDRECRQSAPGDHWGRGRGNALPAGLPRHARPDVPSRVWFRDGRAAAVRHGGRAGVRSPGAINP